MTLTLATAQTVGSLAHALREAVSPVLRKIQTFIEARRNRQAIVHLAHSDERMLKDIGLTHSQVVGALEARFSEDPSTLLQRVAGTTAFEKNDSRRPRGIVRSGLPVVQGYFQGIA